MTFKQILLASCALVISATAATAQIPSYVPTDGLVGWWPFNGNANDESGNGNDGTVNGATLTEDRFGNAESAYELTEYSNNIIFTNNPQFDFSDTNDITVTYWLKRTTGVILSVYKYVNGDATPSDFAIAAGLETSLNLIGNGTNVLPFAFEGNEWQHITAIFSADSNQSKVYLNGNLVLQGTLNVNNTNGPAPLAINYAYGIDNYTRGLGKIDDLCIYNRALTPQEIQNLYNSSTETVDTGNGAAPLPQGIPYQAAARDAQGQSLVNAAVNVRFTLREVAADGAASYAETHALTTNSVGLFNTVFGSGTPEQSAFDSINWAATTKFLQVEIDLGEGYVDMGTTQLLSVPYALRSDEAARVKNAGLPIFNDNAAALSGGLVAGEMYRTAAGVLMVAY
jgi:hypothetical protein